MTEPLYPYYERELIYLRKLVEEFAGQHRIVAQRLQLEPTRSTDSHVERLLQTFALLAGGVQQRLNDEFPEVTDALLDLLAPHLQAPIPSLAVVRFDLDPTRTLGYLVRQHSVLRAGEVDGVPCKYRTAYPVPLWPIRLTAASFQPPPFSTFAPGLAPPGAAAVLRLRFECAGPARFPDLKDLRTLRLFLDGEPTLVSLLYEFLFNHARHVVTRQRDSATAEGPVLQADPATLLGTVGFAPDEGLLPYLPATPLGYRLLSEFFTYPAKFQFVDLGGWQRVGRAGFDKQCEVAIFFDRTHRKLEQGIDAAVFQLGCTPVVNLFTPSPVTLPVVPAQHDYPLVIDEAAPRGYEVYAVESVTSKDAATGAATVYHPYHATRHETPTTGTTGYWFARRTPALREDDRGTDVTLSLVERTLAPTVPREPVLVVQTTCTNRDLPTRLAARGTALKFELEAAAPLAGIRTLRPPTPPLRPERGRGGAWRLLSHLTPNHLALTDGPEGLEALRDVLRLYQPAGPAAAQQLIEALVGVSYRRVIGRIADEVGTGFGRGIEIALEFDEERLGGASVYLAAAVLERYLSQYVVAHSFTQLIARRRGGGLLRHWPPRPGQGATL